MWTGFYAGLNAGYNWGTNTDAYTQNWGTPIRRPVAGQMQTIVPSAPISMDGIASNAQDGFMGGAQIGYNYQWSNSILLGVEADIQGSNTRGASRTSGAVTHALTGVTIVGSTGIQGGVDYLGTVRGRIGYLWNPTLLLYGTGGFAYGGAFANVAQVAGAGDNSLWFGGGQRSQLLTGWTAGGGVEWMFMPNWSLKAEALYWDLGRMNIETATFNPTIGGNSWGRSSVNYSGVTARAGINYHFTWGGSAPVVAKY